ncbi:2,3-bisphosphoglycerate-dependent phosphoglycerate mutase [Rhizosphaericola mali]|uniref:2,3-bisphosphoglycerate-dependent phosphoglycerate mutase n=1 Tax=Rhizosphaericola mali TaxID=2545455 RepID=A0A5P2G4B2_9BACT|nr:2,3-bisphosphoglycerate-dependent phosphoglycerate mutase [Rhizosphaericola mali]QES88989.1 2,3-bisphosphoglycerate-dependent phosphoglycerate mutase [Rhizosphaericola mali]
MPELVIVRHGQSQWNLENRFTGEVDVDLTDKGREEAHSAGKKLEGYHFDLAFTSELKRAQETLEIILNEIKEPNIPIHKNKALNERNYGDLQGLNKAETAIKFGEEQVHIWRRSYDIAPPNGESLKDTYNRVIPYYQKEIAPLLHSGKNIIIAAHGNSLRSLMMYLENITAENIVQVNIPTGVPRVYTIDKMNQTIISTKYL